MVQILLLHLRGIRLEVALGHGRQPGIVAVVFHRRGSRLFGRRRRLGGLFVGCVRYDLRRHFCLFRFRSRDGADLRRTGRLRQSLDADSVFTRLRAEFGGVAAAHHNFTHRFVREGLGPENTGKHTQLDLLICIKRGFDPDVLVLAYGQIPDAGAFGRSFFCGDADGVVFIGGHAEHCLLAAAGQDQGGKQRGHQYDCNCLSHTGILLAFVCSRQSRSESACRNGIITLRLPLHKRLAAD